MLRNTPVELHTIGFCIGTNQVDIDAAERVGVPVFNAPFSNTRSVAELVLALLTFDRQHDLLGL